MISLERHIEILLLDNDCVIVPDFGGFMAHHVSAHYVEEDQIFYPPIRTIGFNPQLTINDSLLAQSYIDVFDISYPEALNRISEEVSEVRQHLQNEGFYELSDIGTIYLSGEGIYQFTPCEAGILTPSLYGFSSLEIPTLASTQSVQIPAQQLVEKTNVAIETPVQLSDDTENKETQFISIEDKIEEEEENNHHQTVQIKVSVLRNIAAACLVLLAFFLFPTPLENKVSNAEMFGQLDTNILERVLPKEGPAQGQTPSLLAAKKESGAKTVSKASTSIEKGKVAQKVSNDPFFTIVLASKVTRTNAQEYVKQLVAKGFTQAKVYTNHKNNKVIFGQFTSEQEAYTMLNKLLKQHAFEDGWVLKINNPQL